MSIRSACTAIQKHAQAALNQVRPQNMGEWAVLGIAAVVGVAMSSAAVPAGALIAYAATRPRKIREIVTYKRVPVQSKAPSRVQAVAQKVLSRPPAAPSAQAKPATQPSASKAATPPSIQSAPSAPAAVRPSTQLAAPRAAVLQAPASSSSSSVPNARNPAAYPAPVPSAPIPPQAASALPHAPAAAVASKTPSVQQEVPTPSSPPFYPVSKSSHSSSDQPSWLRTQFECDDKYGPPPKAPSFSTEPHLPAAPVSAAPLPSLPLPPASIASEQPPRASSKPALLPPHPDRPVVFEEGRGLVLDYKGPILKSGPISSAEPLGVSPAPSRARPSLPPLPNSTNISVQVEGLPTEIVSTVKPTLEQVSVWENRIAEYEKNPSVIGKSNDQIEIAKSRLNTFKASAQPQAPAPSRLPLPPSSPSISLEQARQKISELHDTIQNANAPNSEDFPKWERELAILEEVPGLSNRSKTLIAEARVYLESARVNLLDKIMDDVMKETDDVMKEDVIPGRIPQLRLQFEKFKRNNQKFIHNKINTLEALFKCFETDPSSNTKLSAPSSSRQIPAAPQPPAAPASSLLPAASQSLAAPRAAALPPQPAPPAAAPSSLPPFSLPASSQPPAAAPKPAAAQPLLAPNASAPANLSQSPQFDLTAYTRKRNKLAHAIDFDEPSPENFHKWRQEIQNLRQENPEDGHLDSYERNLNFLQNTVLPMQSKVSQTYAVPSAAPSAPASNPQPSCSTTEDNIGRLLNTISNIKNPTLGIICQLRKEIEAFKKIPDLASDVQKLLTDCECYLQAKVIARIKFLYENLFDSVNIQNRQERSQYEQEYYQFEPGLSWVTGAGLFELEKLRKLFPTSPKSGASSKPPAATAASLVRAQQAAALPASSTAHKHNDPLQRLLSSVPQNVTKQAHPVPAAPQAAPSSLFAGSQPPAAAPRAAALPPQPAPPAAPSRPDHYMRPPGSADSSALAAPAKAPTLPLWNGSPQLPPQAPPAASASNVGAVVADASRVSAVPALTFIDLSNLWNEIQMADLKKSNQTQIDAWKLRLDQFRQSSLMPTYSKWITTLDEKLAGAAVLPPQPAASGPAPSTQPPPAASASDAIAVAAGAPAPGASSQPQPVAKDYYPHLLASQTQWNKLVQYSEELAKTQEIFKPDVDKVYHITADVFCCKQTAVSVDGSYLHANEVGQGLTWRKFVASQFPTQPDVNQGDLNLFWKAVFEKSATIFDLSNAADQGREPTMIPYYPEQRNVTKIYGDITVELTSNEAENPRIYQLVNTKTSQTRNISRYHFATWPDRNVVDVAKLDELVQLVEKLCPEEESVAWIHCRAGIGRTGTLITAVILKALILAGEITAANYDEKLNNIIKDLRAQRCPYVVQELIQLDLLRQYAEFLLDL